MGKKLDEVIGVLNGTIGDHLARTGNGLGIAMGLYHDGQPLAIEPDAIRAAHPDAGARAALLVHGIMCTESVWQFPDGSDYGTMLQRDLGITPLYVRYNSGLSIPDNGASLARLLESLAGAWPAPLEEIILIGFSMGGLLVRSACHTAHREKLAWLGMVRRALYVGTPHRGAPTERAGRVLARVLRAIPEPVTRLIADIGDLRSDGIKDLGDADVRHEDRARRRDTISLRDPRHPVPLLDGMEHHLIAGSLSQSKWLTMLFGDAIVPVSSATDGRHGEAQAGGMPSGDVRLIPGVAHLGLAHHPEVYAQIRAWCEETK
ncbi:MAG: alpha/beta hydrolase [Deltaproteobacteria bacterium]|nr:alpha/beta hydrolase [Deltaproteobacteria bacterium]